jgi:hypothetical protein
MLAPVIGSVSNTPLFGVIQASAERGRRGDYNFCLGLDSCGEFDKVMSIDIIVETIVFKLVHPNGTIL